MKAQRAKLWWTANYQFNLLNLFIKCKTMIKKEGEESVFHSHPTNILNLHKNQWVHLKYPPSNSNKVSSMSRIILNQLSIVFSGQIFSDQMLYSNIAMHQIVSKNKKNSTMILSTLSQKKSKKNQFHLQSPNKKRRSQ